MIMKSSLLPSLAVASIAVLALVATSSASENPETQHSAAETHRASAAATRDKPFVNSLGMKFVPVAITGGPTDGKRVLFSVWDTRVQDYGLFAKEKGIAIKKPRFEQGPKNPAVNVSWEDAKAFCVWLTEKDQIAGKIGLDERYRLPSDHEWSCAVGIGDRENANVAPSDNDGKIEDEYPWGKEWPPTNKSGNYRGEEYEVTDARVPRIQGVNDGMQYTSPVGSFAPNRYGLYDMGGNVWQWCEDLYDSLWPARVARGASWYNYEKNMLLSSFRFNNGPGDRAPNFGFRCVLTLREKSSR